MTLLNGKNVPCSCGCGNLIYRTAYQLQTAKLFFFDKSHKGNYMNQGKEIPCEVCGTLKYFSPKYIKKNKYFFCSPEHVTVFRKNKKEITCDYCGEKILRIPSQLEKYKNHFCKPEHHAKFMERDAETEQKHKQKMRARYLLFDAVRKGIVIKQDCDGKGKHKGKIQAHHTQGYADKNALDVHWYCYRHHKEEHERLRQQGIRLG